MAVAHQRIHAVIFDLDGTLADTLTDLAQSLNFARSRLGLEPLSDAVVRHCVGGGVNLLLQRAFPGVPADRIVIADQDFRGHYAQHLLDRTVLYPGIREVLSSLHPRPMAVLTNKPEAFAREIITGLGIADFFKCVLGGDSLARRKPHPEPVLRVLSELNILPGQAIMVGDGCADILAARAAGVASLAVGYGFSDLHEMAECHPDYCAQQPEDILTLLRPFLSA